MGIPPGVDETNFNFVLKPCLKFLRISNNEKYEHSANFCPFWGKKLRVFPSFLVILAKMIE